MTVPRRRFSFRALGRLAFAVALVAGTTTIANAQAWSRHPALCRSVYPEHPAKPFGSGLYNPWEHSVTVICPITDTSARPDSQITEVRLYGRSGHSADWKLLSARPCRTARSGLSAECGPWVELWIGPGSDGNHELAINPGSTWQPTDFGYLEVILPASPSLENVLFIGGYVLVY
jgi:hypothetical protein